MKMKTATNLSKNNGSTKATVQLSNDGHDVVMELSPDQCSDISPQIGDHFMVKRSDDAWRKFLRSLFSLGINF